ncbi:MAG: hypothetical protein JO334_08295, partial [Verrucomicrobia bacterium]|nr:hypothetical protein [Verrucomicrobiota bacterium]
VRRVTYRFGRRLVGRLKRLLRWEFWPPYIFYTPVIAFIAYLGLRFRSFTLFTAANPAMPASGFVGESKHEILGHLKNAGSCLPWSTLLREGTAGDRLAQAAAFMKKRQLSFPIVLKPDAGQRGSGVVVVRSSQQLQEYLCRASFPIIVQEHVPGKEFGVFYFRYPNEKPGRIFSVTEKRMPVVVGDGSRTLEELILADDRAVCMADFYLRNNCERAHDVLAAGEKVQLVEIGTHCRGAIFLDGSYAITPTLEATIERIASTFDGFFFGRFDIRVPTVEDFMSGQNLKIIELNGVTSEATHIYDPKRSLVDAYRVLFEQWRIAFEIGHKNRERGVRPSSVTELFRMIRDYRGLARKYPE